MRFFVKATLAPKPKTKESKQIAYFFAAILLIMAFCQLFTFEGFLSLIESFWLPLGNSNVHLLVGLIVILEVFAIPFLIGIKLSPAMRFICMICGWIVSLIWIILTLWINLTVNKIANVGYLGDLVDIVPGWWAVFMSICFGIMAAWASWGMWPIKSKRKIKL